MSAVSKENICSNCLKQNDVHLICIECDHVQLCISCYCFGAESGMHKKNHGYRISRLNLLPHSILEGWNSGEELNLLEALEQYGIGNWEDIALKVGTKSSVECMDHYCSRYLDGVFGLELLSDNKYPSRITDHTNHMMLSPTQPSHSTCIDTEDQQLLGYMPNRGDFERDYDNDAESILCRLHPSFSHDDLEDALKVAQVNIYMQRLRERQRRKEIACDHALIPHILASILNKRIKRRVPVRTVTKEHTPSKSKRRGRPPLLTNVSYSKLNNKITPMRKLCNTNESVNKSSSKKPSPNSWLAAPFILQSSGLSKGAPIVVNISSNVVSNHILTNSKSANPSKLGSTHALEDFNGFYLNEKLKPFLRYFTGLQGKHFMENLYKEELIKHEIKHLLDLRAKGKTQLMGIKIRFPPFKSSIYHQQHIRQQSVSSQTTEQPHQQQSQRLHHLKKRRKHLNTPWYMKVQRRLKQYK
ncbi:Transcriptional adapter 2-beta [Schistosoma japonicum]|uniref:Transcriptional adapter 2-beta n=2 Tax=Schistosoma japonicum TaxID=6182 RepID=A0A4Z2DGY6_SCHJA|nr:Transcriptional adapter 2-beta [Schistosoma japonicum]KAH8855113.1 Transcriptional adapter 2-beta [Schistosoma japonicum]TNN15737.1 Transcriptional adapter 2-beta [Schistosoma japonicum]